MSNHGGDWTAFAVVHSQSLAYVWVIVGAVLANAAWWGRRMVPRLLNSPTSRRDAARASLITFAIVGGLVGALFLYGQLLGALGYRALSGRGAAGFVIGMGLMGWRGFRWIQRRRLKQTGPN